MVLRVAIQMDPIGSIHPDIDTTLLLMLEAQKRGHALWYYTPDKLSWRDGKVTAQAHRIAVRANPRDHYTLKEAAAVDLSTMDVVLLRQDPPFDMAYLTTTYLLEQLHPKTLVVNHPGSVRDYPEKLFPTLFSRFMPPTLIAFDVSEIERFRREQKDIILKPLYGHGGRSILRVKKDDDNFSAYADILFSRGREPWVAQRYLPARVSGERRVIMIDGKIAAVAGRIPGKGQTGASLLRGAKYVKAKATRRQMEICEALAPVLKKHGLIFAGLDIIGNYLTEVNITSPGSLPLVGRLYGRKLESDFWNAIERRL